eukprot:gene13639-13754_t
MSSAAGNDQSADINKNASAFGITPSSSSPTTANSLFANAQLSAEKQQMLQVLLLRKDKLLGMLEIPALQEDVICIMESF